MSDQVWTAIIFVMFVLSEIRTAWLTHTWSKAMRESQSLMVRVLPRHPGP